MKGQPACKTMKDVSLDDGEMDSLLSYDQKLWCDMNDKFSKMVANLGVENSGRDAKAAKYVTSRCKGHSGKEFESSRVPESNNATTGGEELLERPIPAPAAEPDISIDLSGARLLATPAASVDDENGNPIATSGD